MKMATVSIVLFVILLAGTVQTSLGDCNIEEITTRCKPSTSATSKSEQCRVAKVSANCFESAIEGCDNPEIKENAESEIAEARHVLKHLCGHAAVGQVSSLYMCLGLASLAYFLTKFR